MAGLRYADAALAAAEQELALSGIVVDVSLEPGEPLALGLRASVDGVPPGSVTAEISTADPAALAGGGGLPPLDVKARVSALSTALVDAWAGRDGLFSDLLGPSLTLELDAVGLTATAGAVVAKLDSELSTATISGRLEEGLVLAAPGQTAAVHFSLTPLASSRVVGGLLPLVAQVSPSAAEQRGSLVLEDFSLPLSADLSKLSGTVRLDLGEVAYAFLPALQTLIRGSSESKVSRLGPYELRIAKGVVAYDKIPLRVGGRELAFRGSYDLGKQEMSIATDVPLSMLGKDVNELLEKNRSLLSPDLAVPIEIHGTWKSPRVRIPGDFVKKLVEDAAKNALRAKLLEKLGGGGKKKDG
jgi:hypothetical protein